MPEDARFTKRSVVKSAGAALALGVGAAGSASAHCDACDVAPEHCCETSGCCEDIPRFCSMDCVRTTEQAAAYDVCPLDGQHVAYVEAGRTGFVTSRCTGMSDCYQGVKVDFCGEQWWVRSDDLQKVDQIDCTC